MKKITFALVATVLFFTAAAQASLVTDTNAMSAYQGSAVFASLGNYVKVHVEYAVYDRGQFDLSFPGQDPTGGADYIYAYQVFNTDLATSSYVDHFSVGLTSPGHASADIDFVAGPGVDPNNTGVNPPYVINPATALWSFKSTHVVYGQSSDVLFFASPFAPTWHSAEAGGALSGTHSLPSPTPEPATMAFLAVGGAMALLRRRA